jgi:predicted PurR-regulated permease PerM
MGEDKPTISPRWGGITKLIVALTAMVIIGALVVRFHTIIVPILMAFILSYLLYPLASVLDRKTRLNWRGSVTVIFLILLALLIALLTLGGVGLVQQIQNLITTIQSSINALPGLIEDLSGKAYQIGPFELDLSTLDWGTLGQEILSNVQPALGKLGGLVGALATSAAGTLGWTAFVFIVSYFVLAESDGLREGIFRLEIPGYGDDLRRLGQELGRIWNAFLRGQMIVFFSTVIVYTIVLTILGVRYSFGLALIAGFANFLPYVGPAINWLALGLVTFFQGYKPFGLSPLAYTVMILLIAVIIDQIFNSLVVPRIMAQALKIHPAAILITAIIAASLLGVLGVILAAPLLATLHLIGRYTLRKMFDKDPWPEAEVPSPPAPSLWLRIRNRRRKRKEKRASRN